MDHGPLAGGAYVLTVVLQVAGVRLRPLLANATNAPAWSLVPLVAPTFADSTDDSGLRTIGICLVVAALIRRCLEKSVYDRLVRDPLRTTAVAGSRAVKRAVRTRIWPCPRRFHAWKLEGRVGFEPTTRGLKVPCSAAELPAL
jgi:hypothetical protein